MLHSDLLTTVLLALLVLLLVVGHLPRRLGSGDGGDGDDDDGGGDGDLESHSFSVWPLHPLPVAAGSLVLATSVMVIESLERSVLD